ncbi:MAG: thiolase family protein [Mesorhizobium sp.]|uniref:thiolase family protein n=1 Tax=Mesorhizobium sp. TaxID=1871066 RepID=UPI001AC4AFC0|nr:thiolase family protein [Mesorhizobium sp.]MBN9221252.1 thiolase family protein [Mesorhizobium sp.]
MTRVAVVGARRTPIGAFMGELSAVAAPELGGFAISAALRDSTIAPSEIDETLMGIVLPAGVGQAPARQASLAGGLPLSTPATAISKVCGSGMKAVIEATALISSGMARAVVAGGMESMSRAPHLLPASRQGQRLGHGKCVDHMLFDGLEDAYNAGTLMGKFAEDCATRYAFSRQQQDDYAITSLSRSLDAAARGALAKEIVAIPVKNRTVETIISADEQPRLARPEKIRTLKPAFAVDGTVTAASSSSISDGAAALVLTSADTAAAHGLEPRAFIVGSASHAQEPELFTTAPAFAARKLMISTGWRASDVDLWEVNEAFAVVALAFIRDLEIPPDRVNVNGGACALGHPIGASGARILVTLLHALEERALKRGIAAICIGGGEALAVAIERS